MYVFITGVHIVSISVVLVPISSSGYTADTERFRVTFRGFPLTSEIGQHLVTEWIGKIQSDFNAKS